MKTKQSHVAAVIEIGSSAVRMRIAQWSREKITILDKLEKPVHIGQEVFTVGRISFEVLRSLSAALDGLTQAAKEYGAERLRVVATTAIREATNRAYIIDHLHIRNHIEVEVLEEGERNAIIFSDLLSRLRITPDHLLLAYVGTGSIGLAACESGNIALSQSLRVGTLKIIDILEDISANTRHIDRAVEEYLDAHLNYTRMLHNSFGSQLAIAGNDTELLLKICGAALERKSIYVIDGLHLMEAWEQMKSTTSGQLAARHDITVDESGRLYATAAVYAALLRLTGASQIHCPQMELLDALLTLQLKPGARRAFDDALRRGVLASACGAAERYHCRIEHVKHVAQIASLLFQCLRKIHGLSRRQCMLLETACFLHEIGFYANVGNPYHATYALVRDASLYGLPERDAMLIACIAGERNVPEAALPLDEAERLFIAKMHAILRLADALDYARMQKMQILNTEVQRNRLYIRATAWHDVALESWAFTQASPLFEEVFGLAPQLDVERVAHG